MAELVDRAAIEPARSDEIVARPHDGVEHQHLRRMAGRHRQRGRAAFKRGDPLLQHRLSGVHDAGVDVSEGLQAEQRRRVIRIVENIGRGLVDRRSPGAGGRVRLGPGMNGERVEPRCALGH